MVIQLLALYSSTVPRVRQVVDEDTVTVVIVVEAEAEAVEAVRALQLSLRPRQKRQRKSTYTNRSYLNGESISWQRLSRPPQMDTTLDSMPIFGLMLHDRRLQTFPCIPECRRTAGRIPPDKNTNSVRRL